MIYLNIILTVSDEANVAKVQQLLTELVGLCREEPGCIRYDIYHSQNDAKVFIINEWWESAEALDLHRTATGYLTIYKPQVLPLAERVPHPCDLLGE